MKTTLKGTQSVWYRADLDTSFLTEKISPQPEIKVHLEIRFNFHSVLLDFQTFTEKPVFECPFVHPVILFLSQLVKNRMDRVSVACRSNVGINKHQQIFHRLQKICSL